MFDFRSSQLSLPRYLASVLLLTAISAAPLFAQGAPEQGQARIARPTAEPQKTPEEIEHEKKMAELLPEVLEKWSASSKRIERLQAEQKHYKFDHTFKIVTQSQGKIYFEAPGKGRIDMEPIKGAEGVKFKVPRNGENLEYEIRAEPEQKWISDGTKITQIDESDKTYRRMPIPEELHGAKVMNGPLPFLFGLPPDEAHRRFELKLLNVTDEMIIISAIPRTAQDYQNFKMSIVKLHPENYLPLGVKLFQSDSEDETFIFDNFEINKGDGFFGIFKRDPFDPSLFGYKEHQDAGAEPQKTTMRLDNPIKQIGDQQPQAAPQPQQPPVQARPQAKPNPYAPLIGLHYKEAKAKVVGAGYEAKLVAGQPTTDSSKHYHVYDVEPDPENKKILKLMLYDNPERGKK